MFFAFDVYFPNCAMFKSIKTVSSIYTHRHLLSKTFVGKRLSTLPPSFNFWVSEYFQNNDNYFKYPKRKKGEDFEKISIRDLPKQPSRPLVDLLDPISTEISSRLDDKQLELHELLLIVSSLVLYGRKINKKSFELIDKALPMLKRFLINDKMTVYNKIQFLFLLSQITKSGADSKKLLLITFNKISLDELKLIDYIDLSIFCNSLFQCSVPIVKDEILELVANEMKIQINRSDSDLTAFVCLVKTLRHSKYYDMELLESMAWKWSSVDEKHWLHELPLISRVHLTIYYADGMFGDVEFMRKLLGESINEMTEKMNRNEFIRVKDVDNLLWSASNYCDDRINRMIQISSIPKYTSGLIEGQKYTPNVIVNLLLWLWIAECHVDNSIARFITKTNIKYIKGSKNFKDLSKLNLLLACIAIESPNLVTFNPKAEQDNRLEPRHANYLAGRPQLKTVLEWLEKHKQMYSLTDVRLAFQVPGYYIGGITANHGSKRVNIEVLDETVCLRNTNRVHGKMKLKLRLLHKLPDSVITIRLMKSEIKTDFLGCLNSQLKQGLDSLEIRL